MPGHPLHALAEKADSAADPERALELLVTLQGELDAVTREQVRRLLHAGRTFTDVARVMGISRQAAHRRFRDLGPDGPTPRRPAVAASAAARRMVRVACEEAVQAGAEALGSEHILIAALRCGGDASRALEAEGVTLEATRACVRAIDLDRDRAPDPGGPPGRFREVLQEAVRVAEARRAGRVDQQTVLVAALADPHGGARRVLAALGADLGSVRARLGGEADRPAR